LSVKSALIEAKPQSKLQFGDPTKELIGHVLSYPGFTYTLICPTVHRRDAVSAVHESAIGRVSRVSPVHTAIRNCTRHEGGPFEVGNQVLISSHRKLLLSKAIVLGRVHFQTSYTPQAQQKFDRGLAIPGSLSTGSILESTMKGNCNE
jgi:hypothetical protein